MRALVTGGTGFVGSNLVAALLRRGIEVRVLRRSSSPLAALAGLDCETRVGDVNDGVDALTEAMADCDWVFHTAAISDYWRYRTQTRLYRTNVDGTRDMAAAAARAEVKRFVFTSSLAALGVPERGRHLVESDEFNIRPRQFPYGHSKHLAEAELGKAVAAGLPAVIVNPSVVIGPRDVHRIASAMLVQAQQGRLWFAAPGGTNFVSVDDVVAGHIAAAEHGQIGQRYILGGENLLFREVFGAANELFGRRPPSVVLPRWLLPVAAAGVSVARTVVGPRLPIDARQMRLSTAEIYADATKSRTELGVPFTPFTTALRAGYQWYRDNGYLD
ncbi:NAD-dependent epimerase/dehydratase family protein [Mycolicibacter hiberniae]|uniref:Dihydroflavonol-4-reductase n=1 Tax=Mycolicibacter hiberniae TaxID=29314 RepID=A0A7I7X8D0_9MYCO|nr:NAD-dependent epimerase/dehydratase family protein [Mycolicibacter hiberniae]MCV7087197.1 NAD-dependent epimerase/dehydratase family protein [Mycolicibacter hiberniae]ORV67811.1 nucleoside-diphosphate sugar epimerase [Mycolicibacter hiberniae]BBZ25590.1 dihydroflavonol-4-reductase [Mycolicibacter hiberniae]